MLEELLRIAREHDAAALLMVGDLIESDADPQARDQLLWFCAENDRDQRLTIPILGNHDPITHRYSHLNMLRLLETAERFSHVRVVNQRARFVYLDADTGLACLPAARWTTEQMDATITKLRPKEFGGWFGVAHHGMIRAARDDSGNDVFSRTALVLPERPDVVRWFLGDIHCMQQIRNAWYCGAPIQHHYGDAGGVRGVLLHDTESDADPQFIQLRGIERVVQVRVGDVRPTNALVQVTGTATELAQLSVHDLRAVASTKLLIDDQAAIESIDTLRGQDMLDGLDHLLYDCGLEPHDVQYARELLQQLCG